MNKDRENSLESARATAPAEGSSLIGGARALFDQLAGEVTRQAEQDRAAARSQGPVAKVLFTACFAAGVLAAATLFYGASRFPDAPIRERRSGYVGKTGRPHTRQHYNQFLAWEKWMATTFGLAFLTGFAGAAAEKLARRGHHG